MQKSDLKNNTVLNEEVIGLLGFTYNYFEGYTYSHVDGYSLPVGDWQNIHYKGKWYDCKTVGDFRMLAIEST
jgi:hypothetical protein